MSPVLAGSTNLPQLTSPRCCSTNTARWLNEEEQFCGVSVRAHACASQLRQSGGGEATHVLRDALEGKVRACQPAATAAYQYVI